MRLTPAQGEARALKLAKEHLGAQAGDGWTFRCLGREGDGWRATRWSLLVECSKEADTRREIRILEVDLAHGEVIVLDRRDVPNDPVVRTRTRPT